MADLQLDIEGIVREVLRRLQAVQGAATNPVPRAAANPAPVKAVPVSVASADAVPPNVARAAGSGPQTSASAQVAKHSGGAQSLQLCDRVVTLASLDGRLAGIKRVLVPANSLVTPAVRDELRKRQVELVRGGNKSPEPASVLPQRPSAGVASATSTVATLTAANEAGLAIGVVAGTQDPALLVKMFCGDLGQTGRLTSGSLLEVVQGLAQAIVGPGRNAVLFTSQPAAAVCVANRWRGVRAVWGWSVAAATESAKTIGANLLVVDPHAHSVFQVRQMIRAFSQAGVGDCPPELRAALDGNGA